MRRRQPPPGDQATPLAIRLAWWAGFLATLALVFALAQTNSEAALLPAPSPSNPGGALTAADPAEDEEAEFEIEAEEEWEFDEECEIVGEGDEAEEFCEETEGEEGTPAECLLSSAEATVAALPARNLLRLSIHYTARSAAAVKIDYWLRGGRGPLGLGEDRKRFSRTGTFRSTERLTEPQMEKVLSARSFTVELQAVNTPRYCRQYFDQKLTVKRASGGGLIWSEPAARAASRKRA